MFLELLVKTFISPKFLLYVIESLIVILQIIGLKTFFDTKPNAKMTDDSSPADTLLQQLSQEVYKLPKHREFVNMCCDVDIIIRIVRTCLVFSGNLLCISVYCM